MDQAGITMGEVVTSIKRVTDLMGEISSASNEQAAGVSQVGEAVVQMDQVTQQNAALVEEMAAAASSLKSQAQELVQVVATFKLSAGDSVATSVARAHTPKPLKVGMHRPVSGAKKSVSLPRLAKEAAASPAETTH